jgi:hypothetical protein
MVKYNKIFTLECLHGYYKDNICRDMILRPTAATENWIRQNGGVFKWVANNWYFLLPDTVDLMEISRQESAAQLEFTCQSNDMHFINFTDFPFNELGYYYFTNENSNELGNVLLPSVFKTSENSNNEIARINIDLSKFVGNKNSESPVFTFSFRPRSIPWKYYILNNFGGGVKSLSLTGNDNGLFSGPTEVEIAAIGNAYLFDSGENKIPIKEMGSIRLGLQGDLNGAENAVIISDLPNAGPSSLQMDKTEDPALNAVFYIYI